MKHTLILLYNIATIIAKCSHTKLEIFPFFLPHHIDSILKTLLSLSYRSWLGQYGLCCNTNMRLSFLDTCNYSIVSAWVLIPPSKPQTSNFLSPQALKNLASPPGQTKSSDNSNTLHMFNNNTFTDFRIAYNMS